MVFKFIQSDTTSLLIYSILSQAPLILKKPTLLSVLFRLEFLQNCHFLNIPTICFVNICNDIYPVSNIFYQKISTLKSVHIKFLNTPFYFLLSAFGIIFFVRFGILFNKYLFNINTNSCQEVRLQLYILYIK